MPIWLPNLFLNLAGQMLVPPLFYRKQVVRFAVGLILNGVLVLTL